MKHFSKFLMLISIIMLFSVVLVITPLWAESPDLPSFSIPFTFDIHGLWTYGLNFGVHPGATKGFDLSLGESWYPPFPPPGAYFPMFRSDSDNAILDLRASTGTAQVDTYRVGFSPDSSIYPIIFSWPNLSSYYSGPVRLKSDINGSLFDVDMKAQTSYTMTTGPMNDPGGFPGSWFITDVYIIAEGPMTGNSQPVVATFGLGNGGLQAVVNAPVGGMAGTMPQAVTATTSVWFEYGQTKSYGTSTTPQLVTDGTSANVTEPFDPGSLPMNSRLHFRAVAQNTLGTFYGGDRIISNGTPPPEIADDTTKYRTATYRDWADAKDQKNKRKAIKPKPDKKEFELNLVENIVNSTPTSYTVTLTFSIPIDTLIPWLGKSETIPLSCAIPTILDSKRQVWRFEMVSCGFGYYGDTIHFRGLTLKPKSPSVHFVFDDQGPEGHFTRSGDLPKLKRTVNSPGDTLKNIVLRLPMPNLHNVGEDIFGGVSQTPMEITVGSTDDPKGAHTVYHPKYKDVLKSLVKEKKGSDIYHTRAWHCLDTFDKNGDDIKKKQKSLPPDKHNNRLFAEQLTLKLNIAASDSGIFPPGLGDLIYDNSGIKGITEPLDGKTIRAIVDSIDMYLGCNGDVAGTEDPSYFLKVDSLINVAFAGPMDTTSWSCDKVVCTGVKMVSDVPYLHANPNAVPMVFTRRVDYPVNLEPEQYALYQNFPNPFNPSTTIEFNLPEAAVVTLKIFNMLGQEVATLIDQASMEDGSQEIEFDASTLPSGVYFYRLVANGIGDPDEGTVGQTFVNVKKMMLVK